MSFGECALNETIAAEITRFIGTLDLTLGAAHALSVPLIGSGHWGTQYDVSPNAQRVYFIDRTPAARPSDIRLVIGWQAFLK